MSDDQGNQAFVVQPDVKRVASRNPAFQQIKSPPPNQPVAIAAFRTGSDNRDPVTEDATVLENRASECMFIAHRHENHRRLRPFMGMR
jgi:hypothetical protein